MATTVANAVDKWVRNTSSSSESVKAGVNAVTESPMEKAASQADRYLSGVQRAVSEGTWQAGLRSVSLASWKSAILGKGLQRMATGVSEAKGKFTNFMSQFLPYAQQAAAEVNSMPKGGVENGVARASAMIRKLAQFKYQKS